jgi:tetratricopeptide (TPR) repeat protein
MTKLLQFYENYLNHTHQDSRAVVISSVDCSNPLRWIDEVRRYYSRATLQRLLASQSSSIRTAAAWALCYLGEIEHYQPLGFLLRDPCRNVRSCADEARRAILARSQSPWHRRTAYQVEQLLADGDNRSAEELASHLIDETDGRSDAYYLRAWIRFTEGNMELAASDCKRALHLDPFSYQACVALGQCFWHLGNDPAAKECFFEAAHIYPDWEPARAALDLV